MPRLLLVPVIVLVFSGTASAQQIVSAIIPLTEHQTVMTGFRDIPPGQFIFQVTLQSTGLDFISTEVVSTNGLTLVTQDYRTWMTSDVQDEGTIGTLTGGAYFTDYDTDPQNAGPGLFSTTNAYWNDNVGG